MLKIQKTNFRPIHTDNAVQVCFEVSLLSCHIFTLLGFLDGPLAWNPENQTNCLVSMIGISAHWFSVKFGSYISFIQCTKNEFFFLQISALSYLSMCAFTFLFLESLCIANQLITRMNIKILDKIPILIASGFFSPLIYLAIVIPIIYKDLIPDAPKL